MANPKLKIAMYQSQAPYPSLHIMVTSNARFFEERFVLEDIPAAMNKIEAWLRKVYDQHQGKD